jgi:hypothetical protein
VTDYIEGVIALDKFLKQLREKLLKHDYAGARTIISNMRYMSSKLDEQIVKQFPKETGH